MGYLDTLKKLGYILGKTYYFQKKKIYIVNQILNRLHYYLFADIRYMSDDENPILRLNDFVTMDNKYFVRKEIITDDMLRSY